ncbi:MAG TPA: hypothetical protein DD827_10495 [Gammaproteobacteria bacterium]|jgi:putative heme degradation protein|nr:hypothetical protein [Gammaproteobacteria bacterium]
MSHALAQNLISSTVHNRSRNSDYYRGRKNNTPELLQNRIARRVNNGSLKLLLQITDQAGMPVFIESQLSGDSLELQENDARIPLLEHQLDTSWVVTHSSIYGEDYSLELFDTEGLRLCKIWSDNENKACWAQLLDALTLVEGGSR